MGKTFYVCNGHMCGNMGAVGGKCGCCPDGVMVRYVEAPEAPENTPPSASLRDALELVQTYGNEHVLLFHGYPQHKDAHRSRPWWRFTKGLCRPDGVSVGMTPTFFHGRPGPPANDAPWNVWPSRDERHELPFKGWEAEDAVLAHVDRYWPFPEPPPLPGQVWVNEVTKECVTLRSRSNAEKPSFLVPSGQQVPTVLVYGPSCYGPDVPWAPPGWVPTKP